ncbi:amidohydrolase 2 [Salinisphaera sp. C84B14]|uniref:hypothetical protein n=1 Tax=Salinisphaera sp. C84B14 TaxID=1304155 RepID=UPI0033411444
MSYERLFNRLGVLALFLALVVVAGVAGWHALLHTYAGAWAHQPEDADWLLPEASRQLIADSLGDIEGAVVDHRITLLSSARIGRQLEAEPNQPRVNVAPPTTPRAWLDWQFVRHAAGVDDELQVFDVYASRLLRQIKAMAAAYRADVFARDAVYSSDGKLDEKATTEFVANADVVELAARSDGRLTPVISVHPARADALAVIERWADAGVRDVAWWPIAQRIDLAGASARAAYAVMAEHDMRLHTRVGGGRKTDRLQGAVAPDELRAALDAGVRITVSIGDVAGDGGDVMQALFTLLRVPAYRERLTISLDGVLSGKRAETVLIPLLQHPQFFDRLSYASGYPRSALAGAVDLGRLADRGFIDRASIAPLRAIYDVNPLLFVFVTLRQIHLPTTGLALPAAVFERPGGS